MAGVNNEVFTKTGKFWYQSEDKKKNEKDFRATYYYSDAYFFEDSYEYNKSLATMSMCLAFSAFASARTDDYAKKSQNAEDLLKYQLGFDGFDINFGYEYDPTSDSIGSVAANKRITLPNGEEVPLIAVAVRGGGYQKEWASNFTLGTEDDHNGFDHAKGQVINDFLDEYVKKHFTEGTRIKVWITGYSRAAAVSNLVAAELNRKGGLGGCALAGEDIYAYTFATPAGAIKDNAVKYENIFSVFDLNDPVPKVAPRAMDFLRYGMDRVLPVQTEEDYQVKKAEMLKQLSAFESRNEYLIDNFKMKKFFWQSTIYEEAQVEEDEKAHILQGDFLEILVFDLVKEKIIDRENYVDIYQQRLRNFFGRDRKEERQAKNDFEEELLSRLERNVALLLAKTLIPVGKSDEREISAEDLIDQYIEESMPAEIGIERKDKPQWKIDIKFLINELLKFGADHRDFVVTLIRNFRAIRSGHYPEYCLAWLQSADDNYKQGV